MMNKVKTSLLLSVALLFVAVPVLAEKPSVEMGKKLFNSAGLGASQNATSCATCHPDGEGMAKAAANPKLASLINRCIEGPLKGEALSEDSVAMESLKLYIKSLAK